MEEKDLSIIIPIYNVENYIRSCLISILRQNLDEKSIEIILIDDGTPDNSIGVIEDLIKQHHCIQVFHQNNQGPSAARNLGVRKAKGKYILYVDSDDLLVENSLKPILDAAINTKADLIVCDYIVQLEDKNPPNEIENVNTFKAIIKNGHQLFLEDLDPDECYVWRTMYRKGYLEDIGLEFCEGISFEDIPYLQECYIKAKKCVRASYPFYIYRRRHNTLSSAINTQTAWDLNKVIEKVWHLSKINGISLEEQERLKDNLFATFSLNLWYIAHIKAIYKDRNVIVTDLIKRVPDLYFANGLKQKIVSFCFRNMPMIYLKIRSII